MDSIQVQQQFYIGMDPKHREQILSNTEKLVDETDYRTLATACLENNLINRAMLNKIEAVPSTFSLDTEALKRERHRRLFKKLTKRGPEAYQKLKNIFANYGFNAALQRLNEDRIHQNYSSLHDKHGRTAPATSNTTKTIAKNANNVSSEGACLTKTKDDVDNLILEPYSEPINPKNPHVLIKSTHIHDSDLIPVYPMKSQHNRGVLFMVNIIDFVNEEDYRKGAKEDSESMLHLFKSLGFKLYAYENLKIDDFFSILDRVIKSEDVRKAECFVMALMTHGIMDKQNRVEKVELTDGTVVSVTDILNHFNNDVCINLVNKPKIFIFPFCRGSNHDLGHNIKTQADSVRIARIPTVSDILICYATLPGFRSYRNTTNGSWYIQCFCKNMAAHAHNTHFEDLLKMIQNATGEHRSEAGAMQTANYNNIGFNKKLYFNPGVFEEVVASI